jgi:DNA-directed RNA polymerase beta' subunit
MQIGEVVVRLLSPEEICAFSVCEVKYEKIRKNDDNTETPADPRLGTLDETPCKTCGCEFRDCPGHFGHIVLAILREAYIKPKNRAEAIAVFKKPFF